MCNSFGWNSTLYIVSSTVWGIYVCAYELRFMKAPSFMCEGVCVCVSCIIVGFANVSASKIERESEK